MLFVLHQFRANGHPSDGMLRQQQALIRTLPTPTTVISDTLKLWWSWRHRGAQYRHSSALLGLGFMFVAATISASLFSSLVVSTTNLEVLVNSPHCGFIARKNSTVWGDRNYISKVQTLADTYAYECYQKQSLPAYCSTFTKPNISYTTSLVPCPYKSVCEGPDSAHFDSGMVSVGKDFGVNFPKGEDVKFRNTATCSVLSSTNRTRVIPAAAIENVLERPAFPGEEMILFNYGNVSSIPNSTYAFSLLISNVTIKHAISGYVTGFLHKHSH